MNGLAGWYLWDTEEMLEYLEWIRRFNGTVSAEDMVRVFGMDITAPALGIRHAVGVADMLDPSSGWAGREYGLDLHAEDFWPQILNRYASLPGPDEERIRDNLADLADFLETEARKPEAGPDVQIAAVEAEIGRRGHNMFSSDGLEAIGQVRERGMADVVDWIIGNNGATAKTIIWTHNLHAAKSEFRMPDLMQGYLKPMGVLLDQTYGTHYLAIGGAFGSGEFEDDVPPGRRSFELMGVETVDGALAQLGHSAAILSARAGFDAIYYVDRVSRARLTPLALQRYQGQRE